MPGEPIHVLLVEDNPDHAELVRCGLEECSTACMIAEVNDGQAAIDYLLHRGPYAAPNAVPAPHVVLLDLRLPKLDGLEVLKRAKDSPELRRIPIVVLSTSASQEDLFTAYDRHANSYLVKPLDFAEFDQLLRSFAAYWFTGNRRPPA
ncbi:MAG: response regulator [Pirellulales bacterium]